MTTATASLIASLHITPSCPPRILRVLLAGKIFDQPPADWSLESLLQSGLAVNEAQAVLRELQTIVIDQAAERLLRLGCTILTLDDPAYPALLKEIPSPPPLLYVRGNPAALQRPALAVVGTRRPTPYGLAVTERLIRPTASAGVSIISGLAIGIDAAAHRAALANHGTTVAVLGTGIDLTYPWEHHDLEKQILESGGAIVSEFPLGSPPERTHFPQRNRIISGLARATLLVEAGDRSGALITAKFALDQNREVLTVPGSILSPQSVGVNSWLRLGAKPVLSADDILEIYQLAGPPRAPTRPSPDDPMASKILGLVTLEPIHIDELVERSRLDTSLVSAGLAFLEVHGHIRHLGGMYYCLTSE